MFIDTRFDLLFSEALLDHVADARRKDLQLNSAPMGVNPVDALARDVKTVGPAADAWR